MAETPGCSGRRTRFLSRWAESRYADAWQFPAGDSLQDVTKATGVTEVGESAREKWYAEPRIRPSRRLNLTQDERNWLACHLRTRSGAGAREIKRRLAKMWATGVPDRELPALLRALDFEPALTVKTLYRVGSHSDEDR